MNLIAYHSGAIPTGDSHLHLNKAKHEQEYKDPLLKWPLRGCAYSNEVGAAISSLSPKLGTLLWVPALLYFGADIYDKYKTDKTEYNPSGRRGLKQAVFQALASVIMPTAAVYAGQKAISHMDKYTKNGLSTQAKEDATKFCLDYMSRNSLHTHENNIQGYKAALKESLDTYMTETLGEHKSKSTVKKILNWCFSSERPESMALSNKEKLIKFVDDKVDSMFQMRTDLMQNKKPKQLSEKLFQKFTEIKPGYLKEYGEQKYVGKAAKSVLKDFENSQIFKHKMFKTVGGFIALGLMIKPIDYFVEHIIIKKAVEPSLDKLNFS